jgi:hypothetical protein
MSVDIILFASNNVQSRATTNKTLKSGKITKKEKKRIFFFLSTIVDGHRQARQPLPRKGADLTLPPPPLVENK